MSDAGENPKGPFIMVWSERHEITPIKTDNSTNWYWFEQRDWARRASYTIHSELQ